MLLILLYIFLRVPYMAIYLVDFFSTLSRSYEEAAAIDGCTPAKAFWVIMLPLIQPAVITVFLPTFLLYLLMSKGCGGHPRLPHRHRGHMIRDPFRGCYWEARPWNRRSAAPGWDYTGYWRAADVLEFTSHGYDGYVFDENNNRIDFKGYRADCITDMALEFFDTYDGKKPFFMTVSQIEPHR